MSDNAGNDGEMSKLTQKAHSCGHCSFLEKSRWKNKK